MTDRPRPTRLRWEWLVAGLAVLGVAVVAGLAIGPSQVPLAGVFRELLDQLPFVDVDSDLSERQAAIVTQVRLPRVVLGVLVGAALAVAGASYQGVFRNPLADPFLLGAAAGAGLGATVAIVSGAPLSGLTVPLAAFAGAMIAVVLAAAVGTAAKDASGTVGLILAGVAVASFLTALQTFIQQREAETFRQVFDWLLGRLSTSGWTEVRLVAPYIVVGCIALVAARRMLDVMALGDHAAVSLGVSVTRTRLLFVAGASLVTAAAVSVAGLIGFVGLVVPHMIRLTAGTSYRVVLPLAVIVGAAFLVLADLVARSAIPSIEIPVGVVTAFIGGPFFAFLLIKGRQPVT